MKEHEETSWSIGARTLPGPAGASDVLRNAIVSGPVPDVEAVGRAAPKNEAEWLAAIAELDEEKRPLVRDLIEQFPVSVENDEIGGVNVCHVTPAEVDPRHENHLFSYVHGGAYILNGGEAGLLEAIVIALRAKMRVLSIDYRMPPQHPFPAGLDDVVTVYQHLLGNRPAKSMALGGSSAGGGLILAAVHKFIQLGLDLPGALYAGTPWTDLTKTGDSYYTNEGIDRLLVTYDGVLEGAARLYAGDNDLKDPLISPIYGDFHGFPPTFLVTGTRDLFLSNTARAHIALRAAGVVADLLVYEGASHGEYGSEADSPEHQQTYGELNAFLLQHLQ
ncbi:MAG: alpha/beta hydrolase fold domain-containing protein [Chloroflexi bacterium]|nr:alpha/beta hydrolase fold domain-containing protein [Chloroflexota bacterium]